MLDDLLDENGSTVSTDVYATQKWTSKDVKNNVAKATSASRTVKSLHVVETVEESNGTYAVIKNGNVRHKIGPLSKNEVKNNAFYTSGKTSKNADVSVGKTGKTLSLLLSIGNIHGAGTRYEASYLGLPTLG